MALATVRVLTEDVGRTLGFYESIGCEHRLGDRAGPYVEVITPGGFRVGLDQQPEGPKKDENGWSPIIGGIRVSISEEPPSDQIVLSIPVSDLESALAAARNAGGEILAEPSERQDLGLRLAHIRDPNGLLVELTSPIP